MERQDAEAEAETETEERSGGAGHLTAQSTSADTAASAGGQVSAGPMPEKYGHGAKMETEERTGGAGYTPENFTGAAPAALVDGPISPRPAPAEDVQGATGIRKTKREEGGDKTTPGGQRDGGEGIPQTVAHT